MRFKKITAALSCLMLLTFMPVSWADSDTLFQMKDMMDQFKKQMGEMQKTIEKQNDTINRQNIKIQQLESRGPAVTAVSSSGESGAGPMSEYEFNERLSNATGGANKWLKDLSFKGDLRLRYEAFHNTSGSGTETDDRNRFRYRLRYGFEKKFNDDMMIGFSMASGERSSGTQVDPTSINTTFDNLFNFKDIFIEKAYAKYSPGWAKIGPVTKTTVVAGKLDNPFEKGSSDMVWDRDVKPEGVYEQINASFIDTSDFDLTGYGTAGQFVLDEDATTGGDSNLFAYQMGLNALVYTPVMERPLDISQAMSFYKFSGYGTKSNFLIGGTSLARGNSNVTGAATELDAENFDILESYTEVAFYPMGLAVRPFYDFATNTANRSPLGAIGTDENNAWSYGVKLGSVVKKGDWELSSAYKYLPANALAGIFTDSDFGAAGHIGKKGLVYKGSYAMTDNIFLNGAAFFVQLLNPTTGGIIDQSERRFQVDMTWKF